jgi:hypothetical protein
LLRFHVVSPIRAFWIVVALITANPGWSEVLYVGVGEHGEASFSDVAREGHIPFHIEVQPADEIGAASVRRVTAVIEEMADVMAEDRRARDLARSLVRTSSTADTDADATWPEAESRYYGSVWPVPPHHRPPHHRPPHHRPPSARPPIVEPALAPTPRTTFAPAFQPYNPAFGPSPVR